MRRTLTIIAAILFCLPFMAAADSITDSLTFRVQFRPQSDQLDLTYRDNGTQMKVFTNRINAVMASADIALFTVNLQSVISPNRIDTELMNRRSESIRDYIMSECNLNLSQIRVAYSGVDWDMLGYLVNSQEMPWQNEVWDIICSTPRPGLNMTVDEYRISRLKEIGGGHCWSWLEDHVFNKMHEVSGYAKILSLSDIKRKKHPVRKHHWNREGEYATPVASVKTNLFLPLLNVGVEVPVHNRVSLGADFYYPWIPRQWFDTPMERNKNCFQLLAGYFSVNYWLGSIHASDADRKYHLRGHSISLVGGAAMYDFEFGYDKERNAYTGNQGEAYAVGVGYRYALPLGRGDCHIDFDIALGVIFNYRHPYSVFIEKDRKYDIRRPIRDRDENEAPVRTISNIMYGYPIKAGVTLVIPIQLDRQ